MSTSNFFEEHIYAKDSGKLLNESNSYGHYIAFDYDAFQRNTSVTMMNRTYTLSYDDQDDLVDGVLYPSGTTAGGSSVSSMKVGFARDGADRLQTISIPGAGTVSYQYQVGSSGETHSVTYPNNVSMTQTVTSFGEETDMRHSDGWSESNSYDLFGNVINQKRMGAAYGSYVYNKVDRIKEEVVESKKRLYAYDHRGNRQYLANGTGNVSRNYSMKYDVRNRLTEFNDGSTKATYTYYPNGLRASKQVTGSASDTTKYVYLNGYVMEELTSDGKIKARNVWGNQLIWRKNYTTNKDGYYSYNSHGDVINIKDSSGAMLNTYEYDSWGILQKGKVKETMSNPFTYAGEIDDKESEFYYLRARYYDPAVGRFISEDTNKGQVDNPLSLNRYTYTHNNPLRFVDPSGHAPDEQAHGYDDSRIHYIYKSTKDMSLSEALTILSSGKFSETVTQAATGVALLSVIGPDKGGRLPTSAKSIAQYAKLKEVLKTWEAANPLIQSLRETGKLPSNYVTSDFAKSKGWSRGKALASWVKDIDNVQLGGDVFENRKGILPMADGKVWYEADVGLVNTMGRNNQPGTRLVYSNYGEMYITTDHYENFYYVGNYFDNGNMH